MSLLGTTYPKFHATGSADVNLLHSVMQTNYQESDILDHKSILNGTITYVVLGDYSSFDVLVHLFDYDDPKAKFQEIYPYNHTDVYFYPHADGNAMKDAAGADILFHIREMKFEYLADINNLDILRLRFEAKTYTDVEESLV